MEDIVTVTQDLGNKECSMQIAFYYVYMDRYVQSSLPWLKVPSAQGMDQGLA